VAAAMVGMAVTVVVAAVDLAAAVRAVNLPDSV
jgi:hypothetical protein